MNLKKIAAWGAETAATFALIMAGWNHLTGDTETATLAYAAAAAFFSASLVERKS
jgi:hypothetical protein